MLSVAIIGGGPGGLALARLLERSKVNYIVYERNPSSNLVNGQQGGSLDLHAATGQLVMERAGLKDQFEKYARRGANALLLDKSGKQLLIFGEGRDAPEIDRAQLCGLLAESIPPEKIQWNKAVTGVRRDETSAVRISFADGTTVAGFNLVVGADGAWSWVRHLVTPAKPIFSGKIYLEAHVSTNNPIHNQIQSSVGGGTIIAIGSQKHIAVQAMSDGSYRVYIALLATEEQFTSNNPVDLTAEDGAIARRYFLSHAEYFVDWAPELRDIIANSEGPYRRWPLYHMNAEALNWRQTPGVTLLGDAAHVSTPFVGEGVNSALFDALELADRIAQLGTEADALDLAIGEYEKGMFDRGKSLIERSNASAALLFADDPVGLVQVISSKHKVSV